MSSREEVVALVREKAKLAQQVKQLQAVAGALRDEVADANAELAASHRLFEEQKAFLMQEIERERAWREALARQLHQSKSAKVSVGTMTVSESSTTTVADACTNTGASTNSFPLMVGGPAPPLSSSFGGGELEQFASWLERRAAYQGRSLFRIFEEMGATGVDDVCANVQLGDLVERGVPVLKARAVLFAIEEFVKAQLQRRAGGFTSPVQPTVSGTLMWSGAPQFAAATPMAAAGSIRYGQSPYSSSGSWIA